jgi:hypothetical protein
VNHAPEAVHALVGIERDDDRVTDTAMVEHHAECVRRSREAQMSLCRGQFETNER